MRIANELLNSGILGHQKTTGPSEWDFSRPAVPPRLSADPVAFALERREASIKVSARGWRALSGVLTFARSTGNE